MIIDHGKVVDRLVNWIRDYVKTAGKSSLIVGLSDLDSALVALLCKKTNIKTYCVLASILVKNEDETAIKKFTEKSHIHLIHFGLNSIYEDVQKEIDYQEDVNEYVPDRVQFFKTKKAQKTLTEDAIMPIISTISAGFNGIIASPRSKNDLLYRSYSKYGASNADIFPLLNLYKSEIRELFEFVASPMCYGATYLLDREKNKTFSDITDLEVEWADGENIRTSVVTSDISPDKHRDWQRYTLRQRQVIAKLHQLEKLSRHKVNGNVPFCSIRKIDGLVR